MGIINLFTVVVGLHFLFVGMSNFSVIRKVLEVPNSEKDFEDKLNENMTNFLEAVKHFLPADFLNSMLRDCCSSLYHSIAKMVDLKTTKICVVESFYPRTLAALYLWKNLGTPMKIRTKTYVNNHQKKIRTLSFYWECHSHEVMDSMFPHAFDRRTYSDAIGCVEFNDVNKLGGGYLTPCIDASHTMKIDYDWQSQTIKFRFYFSKKKCQLNDESEIVFLELV